VRGAAVETSFGYAFSLWDAGAVGHLTSRTCLNSTPKLVGMGGDGVSPGSLPGTFLLLMFDWILKKCLADDQMLHAGFVGAAAAS
jgi:hypothetical protein